MAEQLSLDGIGVEHYTRRKPGTGANPERLKLAQRKYRIRHREEIKARQREQKRESWSTRRAKILADPVRYQKWLQQKREEGKRRRERIRADPERNKEFIRRKNEISKLCRERQRQRDPDGFAAKRRLSSRKALGAINPSSEANPVAPCDMCSVVRRLHYDHDHKTGLFRGWLCIKCNTKLGWYETNAARIHAYLAGKKSMAAGA